MELYIVKPSSTVAFFCSFSSVVIISYSPRCSYGYVDSTGFKHAVPAGENKNEQ